MTVKTTTWSALNLLRAMQGHGVAKIVFSSTAAVFGEPVSERIDETHPRAPINPYGASKLMVERVLSDAAASCGLRSVCLRYFNAAGASPEGDIDEAHAPGTHLFPNVLRAALGSGDRLKMFGDDCPTPEGICVRDYIHVDDLAQAHWRALAYMEAHAGAHVFNVGNCQGFSVHEVIAAAEAGSGREVRWDIASRLAGDPAVLVTSSDLALRELGWTPRFRRGDGPGRRLRVHRERHPARSYGLSAPDSMVASA